MDDDDDDPFLELPDFDPEEAPPPRMSPEEMSNLASAVSSSSSSRSSGRARSSTARFEPSWDDDNDDADDYDEGGDITDDEEDDFDDDDDDDDDDSGGGRKRKKKKAAPPPKRYIVQPQWPLEGRIDSTIPSVTNATGFRHSSSSSSSSNAPSLSAQESRLQSNTRGVPTKDWPSPGMMVYNWMLNQADAERIEQMDDIGPLNIFRAPSRAADGKIEWNDDDYDPNDLQRLLITIGKREVYQRINLADLDGRLQMCRLCGWLSSDTEKKHRHRAGGGVTNALDLFDDLQDKRAGATVDPYVYNNISRIICESVSRMNPVDACITAALYWLIKAVIPSDGKVPLIRPREIYDHFFDIPCVLDFGLRSAVMARDLIQMQKRSRLSMMIKNAATGSSKVDPTQAKVYIDAAKALKEILAVKRKDMMFHAPELPLDTNLSNSLLGPSDIVQESRKRT